MLPAHKLAHVVLRKCFLFGLHPDAFEADCETVLDRIHITSESIDFGVALDLVAHCTMLRLVTRAEIVAWQEGRFVDKVLATFSSHAALPFSHHLGVLDLLILVGVTQLLLEASDVFFTLLGR